MDSALLLPTAAARRVALVADDDPTLCAALARVVSAAGYAVTTAEDGAAALARVRARVAAGRPPTLVVTDVEMPALDGVALAAAVAGPGGVVPTARVLLVSGRALPADAAGPLDGVRYAFLAKPFSRHALDSALARLLG
jgi:CheY-like chemotaxis protein